jgi:hypothetical protein
MSTPMPPPAPRPFPLRAASMLSKFLLLFGGIWLGVGVLLAGIFTATGGPVWDDWILDARGVEATAEAQAVEPTHSRINGRYVQEIHFHFVDRAGVAHEQSGGTIDRELVDRATKHEPLAVIYDPQAPARVRLRGERASFFGPFVFLPLGFAVIGGLVFGAGLLTVLRVRDIYMNGTPVEATITGVERTAMRVNRRPVMRATYTFKAMSGDVSGALTSVNPPAVGDRVWILHVPAEPEKNVAA